MGYPEGWSEHGDRGRGTFEDNGYADTSDDPRTGAELPMGYKSLTINDGATVPHPAEYTGGHGYEGIPEQK